MSHFDTFMALEGTAFGDGAQRHTRNGWLLTLADIYKRPTVAIYELVLQSMLVTAFVRALLHMEDLVANDCRVDCQFELDLTKFSSPVRYQDTQLVQSYTIELQNAVNEYFGSNIRAEDISDCHSSVTSKDGVSRPDIGIVACKLESSQVQIGGLFELKAYPADDLAGLDDFKKTNNLKSRAARTRAVQGVAQSLFYGSVCRAMSGTQVFAFIYCNRMVRFRFEHPDSNIILMESLNSQARNLEPRSVKDLLKNIQDGFNPLVHDLTTRDGGMACLNWIGWMHMDARTRIAEGNHHPQPLPVSLGPERVTPLMGNTKDIVPAGATVFQDWLEEIDEEGWREREADHVLDSTLAAKVLDRMGYMVLQVSGEQLESIKYQCLSV